MKELYELSCSLDEAREIWDAHRALLAKHKGVSFEFKDFAGFYKWFLNQPSKEIVNSDKRHYEKCCVFCAATKTSLKQDFISKNLLKLLYSKCEFSPLLRIVKMQGAKGCKCYKLALLCFACASKMCE